MTNDATNVTFDVAFAVALDADEAYVEALDADDAYAAALAVDDVKAKVEADLAKLDLA